MSFRVHHPGRRPIGPPANRAGSTIPQPIARQRPPIGPGRAVHVILAPGYGRRTDRATIEGRSRWERFAPRIVSVVVLDAQNLTAQEDLIDFRALDRSSLPGWIADLEKARSDLGRLIRRLREEAGDEDGRYSFSGVALLSD